MLYEEIKDLDIAIFVNNVGTGSYKLFHEHSQETVSDIIKLNSVLPAILSSLVIKKQLNRGKRSALLTMSSASGILPFGRAPIYSSTKAFCRFLGLSLSEEVREKIDCLTLCPGIVNTNLAKGYTLQDMVEPDQAAQYMIDKIGIVEETSACLLHDFIFYCFIPQFYYIHYNVWNFIQEKIYNPIIDEIAKGKEK